MMISSTKCLSLSGALLSEPRTRQFRSSACFDVFATSCLPYSQGHGTWAPSFGSRLRSFSSDTWPFTQRQHNYYVSQFSRCQIKDESKSTGCRNLFSSIDMDSERLPISLTKAS